MGTYKTLTSHMSNPADHTWPDIADAQFARDLTPLDMVRGWAAAYRQGPRDARFPSDPDADFFPHDMDMVAAKIESDAKVIAVLRKALEFYADPAAWKTKYDPHNDIQIPDFYSETSFGDTAIVALEPTNEQTAGEKQGD